MSHFFEATVSGLHRAAYDSEFGAFHFLTQKVIFRIECLLVKSSKFIEPSPVEKHVHAGAEGFVKTRELLHEVISVIEGLIPCRTAGTNDVGRNAAKLPSRGMTPIEGTIIHQESRPENFRRVFELDPSIDTGKIAARMDQGILTLTLPKAEQVKPRKIAVN